MEIKQLIYFVETARLQHMTDASVVLNVAQSALSRQISLLESGLGIRLFKKDGRNIILTEHGKDFYEDAVKILEIVDQTKDKISYNKSRDRQSLNIHITKSDMTSKILHTFQNVLSEYPDIHFNIETHDENIIEHKLVDKSLDIVISTRKFNSDKIKSTLLFDQKYYYIFRESNEMNLPVKASWNELEDSPVITMDPVMDIKNQFKNTSVLNINDPAAIQHLLMHHPYIAILSYEECKNLKHHYPGFKVYSLEHLNIRQPVYFSILGSNDKPFVRAWDSQLQNEFGSFTNRMIH